MTERKGIAGAPAGMAIQVEYSTALFDAETIEAFVARWERLLDAVVSDPGQHIGDVDLLVEEDRQRVLAWGESSGDGIPTTTLPALFEDQVREHPRTDAVADGRAVWSYEELNVRANRIAHWLIGQGIGPEQLVGVAMPRSAEQVAVVLGILKAGAAYLPIDPDYPAQRITFITTDTSPTLILSNRATAKALPTDLPSPLVSVDEPHVRTAWAQTTDTNPTDEDRTTPLALPHAAYV
ncbi:AMP-binding protein, partial [Streptomyces sp. MCAF7]